MSLARFWPDIARTLRRLRPGPTLEEVAISRETLAEAGETSFPAVLMPEGDFDRVTGFSLWNDRAKEMRRIAGGPIEIGRIERFVIPNALATPGGFFTPTAGLNEWGRIDRARLLRAAIPRRDRGFYPADGAALRFFGHFVKETLAETLLARAGEEIFLPLSPGWAHAPAYVDALGIERASEDFVLYRELAYVRDIWTSPHRLERVAEIHARMQRRLLDRFGPSAASGLYISRAGTGTARDLVNEDELIGALEARGFAIVSARDDMETIWRAGAGVPVSVSIEGSHWNHALFACARRPFHLILNPADRFAAFFAEFMPAVDGRMGSVVMEPGEGGYHVDVDRVMRLLDRGLADRA